ncbi:MAG: FtsX-like permease family protein [Phycisphaerales bacterium]
MKRITLTLRSLRYHWRAHLGVALGTMIASAVLIGALGVGDSVKATLTRQAAQRIGKAAAVVISPEYLFRAELAHELSRTLDRPVVAMLQLPASAATTDGSHRLNGIQLLGVADGFFDLALSPVELAIEPGTVVLNRRVADALDVEPGREIVIRCRRPGALPLESVYGSAEDLTQALRVRVAYVVEDDVFGRFGLSAEQISPANVFVQLAWLAEQVENPGRANMCLVGNSGDAASAEITSDRLAGQLRDAWTPADASIDAIDPERREVRSSRIFLDDAVVQAIERTHQPAIGILTYFVNSIEHDSNATPYSMVSGIGGLSPGAMSQLPGWLEQLVHDDAGDAIIINQWLADDLEAAIGDPISLRYFIIGDADALVETSRDFVVRGIVPIEGLAADPSLMPDFPGIADAERSREWESDLPIDLSLIRDRDEAYWDAHRGTPKAFVSLAAAQQMWAQRFGSLTAVRVDAGGDMQSVQAAIASIDPAQLGVKAISLREGAASATQAATDFGGLFIGLGFFVIAASLILTALLFALHVAQRSREHGVLRAVGFAAGTVQRMTLAEGVLVAILGSTAGIAAGMLMTHGVLFILQRGWSGAVAGSAIHFSISAQSIVIGCAASIIMAVIAMWLATRRLIRAQPDELLRQGSESNLTTGRVAEGRPRRLSIITGTGLLISAITMLIISMRRDALPALSLSSGALMLASLLAFARAWLLQSGQRAASAQAGFSRKVLAHISAQRRPGRSTATMVLLGMGVFLVLAIGANRLQAPAAGRTSGTGGFDLVAESSVPLARDLDAEDTTRALALTRDDMQGVSSIPIRIRSGDETSCLNLHVPQQPRLFAVDASELAGRFSFARTSDEIAGNAAGWSVLDAHLGPNIIPAVADDATLMWTLKRSLGDDIEYTASDGSTVNIRIVATLNSSILQGGLIISRDQFEQHFSDQSGFSMFLVAVDPAVNDAARVAQRLSMQLADVGLAVESASARLMRFNEVQNTYITIFQTLGGLGLLLGACGMGIIVLRNVLERRGELATLRAVGFSPRDIRNLLLREHALLLLLGLLSGAVAAAWTLLPIVPADAVARSFITAMFLLIAMAGLGILWVVLATRAALAGTTLQALRAE